MEKQPTININGRYLSDDQVIALRAAVGKYAADMAAPGALGDDEHTRITEEYQALLQEIRSQLQPVPEVPAKANWLAAFMILFGGLMMGGFVLAIAWVVLYVANDFWKSNDVIWSLLIGAFGVYVGLQGGGLVIGSFTEAGKEISPPEPAAAEATH